MRRGYSELEFLIVMAGLAIMAGILVPGMLRAYHHNLRGRCAYELSRVGQALEAYRQDQQTFPTDLRRLTPRYLKAIPTCPAGGEDDYTAGYRGASADYQLECQGGHLSLTPSMTHSGGLQSASSPRKGSGLELLLAGPGCIVLLFIISARPRPYSVVEEWEQSDLGWGIVGFVGWMVLLAVSTSVLLNLLGLPWGLYGGAIASWLLAKAGWWLWGLLSPRAPVRTPQGGLRVPVLLTSAEVFAERALSFGMPLASLLLMLIPSWLGPDPRRDSLLCLAVFALVSLPLYLWGRTLAAWSLRRELELVPGSGVILEHSCPGGWARTRRLGTVSEIRLESGGFWMGGRFYRVDSVEFLDALGGARADEKCQ